jgi:hypothetical protein
MTARKRPRKAAPPIGAYEQHCQRTAAEAEGWISRHGRGSWTDELTSRRARDAARLIDATLEPTTAGPCARCHTTCVRYGPTGAAFCSTCRGAA